MRKFRPATLLAPLFLAPLLAAATAPSPTATVANGRLRGATADGIVSFKGIPFAAPPVGDLRWRAPQPAARWHGVRDASTYAHDCMQLPFPSDAAPLGTAPAEDCLYANVWKPADAARKLPVLVWIYGGGFVNGGSSPPTYTGAELAKRGIVVFSFNYRLGRFGTFAHPALTRADSDHGLLGNYGYLDQIAALRWVKGNIAAFGGDPANVTIMGESAGGMSVLTLLTSPLTRGLFEKAIVMSGGDGGGTGKADLARAEQAGSIFATSQGIAESDPAALAKLRALPAATVTGDLNLAKMQQPTASSPFPDGRIAVGVADAIRAGRARGVPVMIGATSDDIGGPSGFMIAGARSLAGLLAANGAPTFYYRFDYVAQSLRGPDTHGAGHASDIPYFLDTAGIKYGAATTDQDRRASRLAGDYVVNFVRAGDPNGPTLPNWPKVTTTSLSMLTLGDSATAAAVPDTTPAQ